jgi:hypothetical protein
MKRLAGLTLTILALIALPIATTHGATIPDDRDSWNEYANWVEAYNDGWNPECGLTLQIITPHTALRFWYRTTWEGALDDAVWECYSEMIWSPCADAASFTAVPTRSAGTAGMIGEDSCRPACTSLSWRTANDRWPERAHGKCWPSHHEFRETIFRLLRLSTARDIEIVLSLKARHPK